MCKTALRQSEECIDLVTLAYSFIFSFTSTEFYSKTDFTRDQTMLVPWLYIEISSRGLAVDKIERIPNLSEPVPLVAELSS